LTNDNYSFLKPYIGRIVVVPNPFVKWREEKHKYIYTGVMPPDARLRETVPGIVDLEYDYDEREESLRALEDTEKLLQKDGYKYKVYDHGGRSPHLFIPISGLNDIDFELAKVYKKLFLKKYCGEKKVDESLTGTHLIALEEVAHWKEKYNGAVKKLVRSVGEGDNAIDEKLLQKARRIASQRKSIEDQSEMQTVIIFKELLAKAQAEPFPIGEFNNVVSKNIAIGLVQYGYNDTAITQIVDQLCKTQNMAERTVYGWIEKARRGELQEFNVDEVIKYCYAYEVQLEGMEEFNKDKTHIQFPFDLSWEQLKRITRRVYEMYDALQLYTSDERDWRGKISESPFKNVDLVKVAEVYRSRARNSADLRIFFFDENPNPRVWEPNGRELQLPFYTYDFKTEYKSYTIFSTQKLDVGDSIVRGNLVRIADKRELGYSTKIPVQTEIILVNSAQSNVKKFSSLEEVRFCLETNGIRQNEWFEWLFKSNEKQFKGYALRHPQLFEKMMSSWLLSGAPHGYPLHLLIIAKPGTGKTRLENAVHWKMDELEKPLEGGGCTFKALVPSFANKDKVHIGYLLACSRVAIIDEFLRIIYKVRPEDRDEILGELNTLLEHDEKLYSSAHGNITARMRSKLLSVSNAIRGSGDIDGLLQQGSHAAFSRFFVWYQDEEHIKFIQEGKGLAKTQVDMPVGDWLGVFDFLYQADVQVDQSALRKVFDSHKVFVPTVAKDVYNARYFHHMQCILEGLVKTRFGQGLTNELTVTTQDLDDLKLIWRSLLRGWDTMRAKDWSWGGDMGLLTSSEKKLYELILSKDKMSYRDMTDLIEEDNSMKEALEGLKELHVLKLTSDTNYYVLTD
jgi:hypothetical protein